MMINLYEETVAALIELDMCMDDVKEVVFIKNNGYFSITPEQFIDVAKNITYDNDADNVQINPTLHIICNNGIQVLRGSGDENPHEEHWIRFDGANFPFHINDKHINPNLIVDGMFEKPQMEVK